MLSFLSCDFPIREDLGEVNFFAVSKSWSSFLSTQPSESVVTSVFCADSLSSVCKSSAKADVRPWSKQHGVAKQGLVHESLLFEGTRVLSAVQIDELEAVRDVEMIWCTTPPPSQNPFQGTKKAYLYKLPHLRHCNRWVGGHTKPIRTCAAICLRLWLGCKKNAGSWAVCLILDWECPHCPNGTEHQTFSTATASLISSASYMTLLTLEALRGGKGVKLTPPSLDFSGFKVLLLDRLSKALAQLFLGCEHIFWH